ncbi:MAG: MBL fold metallo-hydrolase [Pyrinomonadaceae bacterium]|nr:MBL fold metallo-hydrolase [Pyrinomonadaceae bacterium]
MKRIIGLFALISVCAFSTSAHVSLIKKSEPQQELQLKLEKVNGNVYALFGRGGNIGVSYGEDGLMTIDTQFEDIAAQLKAELKKLGTDKPKYTFNTHWHGDHTGGNVVFGQDSIIVAHRNVRDRLLNTTEFGGQKRTPTPKMGLPSITYDTGLSIYFNGEEVKAVHFPKGHTDGDTVIFFTGSNVVHLGDDFFVDRFPFVDLASGGSVEGLVKNIGDLIQMIPADAKLIPGHGPVSTMEDLKNYHQMLVETTLMVRKSMSEGKSLVDIKKTGFQEKYKDAGSGFINTDRWIETIYNSYSINMMKK